MLKVEDFAHEGYERVVRGVDDTTGLNAIIAVHNTNLGPAMGGCRVMEYPSTASQVADVTNLARGMTYKSALAGMKLGGGKSNINHPSNTVTRDMWRSFAEFLNVVNDRKPIYYAAGDVGSSPDDLATLAEFTEFVNGSQGSDSGIATAYGVFQATTGALRFTGRPYRGTSFSVKGLGKVGWRLVQFLIRAGVEPKDIYVSDIDKDRVHTAIKELGVSRTSLEDAHKWVDVFMPCAIGGDITDELVGQMDTGAIICGAANNQLKSYDVNLSHVHYVPDFLANAGGVIIVSTREADEYYDMDYDDPTVMPKLDAIADKAWDVLHVSSQTGESTAVIADKLAEGIFKCSKSTNSMPQE